jgi:hypothetical protein
VVTTNQWLSFFVSGSLLVCCIDKFICTRLLEIFVKMSLHIGSLREKKKIEPGEVQPLKNSVVLNFSNGPVLEASLKTIFILLL